MIQSVGKRSGYVGFRAGWLLAAILIAALLAMPLLITDGLPVDLPFGPKDKKTWAWTGQFKASQGRGVAQGSAVVHLDQRAASKANFKLERIELRIKPIVEGRHTYNITYRLRYTCRGSSFENRDMHGSKNITMQALRKPRFKGSSQTYLQTQIYEIQFPDHRSDCPQGINPDRSIEMNIEPAEPQLRQTHGSALHMNLTPGAARSVVE